MEAGRKSRNAKKPPSNNGLLQLLSIARGIYEACGLTMTGPVEHLSIPALPPWGKKICQQLSVTIFKGFVDLSPHEGPVKWRNFGRMLGVGLRELGFIEHDLRREPDAPGKNDFAEKLQGLDELVASVLNGSPVDALFAHFGKSLESLVRVGLGQTPAEQYEFLAGLAEGQMLVLDTQGQFVGDRGRTTIYFELLSRWMQIEEMRRAKPAKTCADLYEVVAPSLGDPHLQRYHVFFRLCRDIGLSMTKRGRPKNIEENK